MKESGIDEWADTNGIVVLYPQATTSTLIYAYLESRFNGTTTLTPPGTTTCN